MQHSSRQINVIPLGEYKIFLLQQFKKGLMDVCRMPTWNGKARLSRVEFDGSQFNISIPSINEIITGQLISSELKLQDRDNLFPIHWGNNFRLCVLVCRLKELVEIQEIREEIAFYRYIMCNLQRGEDIFLLVTDIEKVINVQNSSDYDIAQLSFQELLADGSENDLMMTWKNGYGEKWKKITSHSFGQIVCYYPWDRNHTAVYLDSLYAHWETSQESGYMEILWQIVNILLVEYNIEVSEISNNINYIIMCKRIKSWWYEKTMKRIHVAVVGVPSSGKTLLIGDMKQALSNMGYNILDPLVREHGSLMSFNYKRRDKVTKDEKYAMRSKNIYDAILSYCGGHKHVNITFVNVPGESFDEDNFVKCSLILKIITELGREFTIREIETSTGYRKMVEYKEIDESVVLPSSNTPTKSFKNYNKWDQTLCCLGINKENYATKYKKAKTVKKDGQYIIDHYFDFDTDSVVNAIFDAWGLIEHHIVSFEQNVSMSSDEWFSTFSKHFSFHIYLRMATDIIFCEKLLDNNGKLSPNVDQGFLSICQNINHFTDGKNKINLHVAFRAIDMALINDVFEHIVGNINNSPSAELNNIFLSNIAYSYFMYKLYGNPTNSEQDFKQMIVNKTSDFELPLSLGDANKLQFVKNRNDIITHSTAALQALNGHMRLTPNYIDSPHVFFTGTPITTRFNIFPNVSTVINTAEFKDSEGNLFNTASSICFGSLQLCIDILCHYGEYNHSNDKTYGALLNTLFQNR